jgi:hypothetical protein
MVDGGATTVGVDEQSSLIPVVLRMSELFFVMRTRHGVREFGMHGDSWMMVGVGCARCRAGDKETERARRGAIVPMQGVRVRIASGGVYLATAERRSVRRT